MPDSVILVDFGASRIKSVLWSFAENCMTASLESAAPKPRLGASGEVEFEPEDYWAAFQETAGALAQKDSQVADIWLCTEMHGFLLVDTDRATPLTSYISWQDQRACHAVAGGASTLDVFQPVASAFLRHTGMRLRPGLPSLNLAHLARLGALPRAARFATLSDWLLLRAGEPAPETHVTLAAGTGLYSLEEKAWPHHFFPEAETDLSGMRFSPINDLSKPLGQISLAGRTVRVWGGVGDMQAAAHGGTFPRVAHILINLGTGSQVMAKTAQAQPGVDRRLSVLGEEFQAVTHIPSGRAINVFASLLDEAARLGGGEPFFWKMFSELEVDEVLNAPASIDLNVFQAAWKYSDGGKVTGIHEHGFGPRGLALAIARSWLQQYVDALETLAPAHPSASFLLTGGLSRRAGFIAPVLEHLLGRTCLEPVLRTGEDTLDGLLSLAERQCNSTHDISQSTHNNLQ